MDGERRGDWENEVNKNLVGLNSAQLATDSQIDDLEIKYEALDKILRGDPADKDNDGLAARLHALENSTLRIEAEFRRINADVNGDHAGGAGHEQRISKLEGRRESKERREGYFWHFVTATASGTLLLAGLLILNWERVEDFARSTWAHVHHGAAAAGKSAKAKKSRRSRKQKPIVLPELGSETSSSFDVP